MKNQTIIKGKDRDLESSIAIIKSDLELLDMKVKEVSSLNPLPFVYSTFIQNESSHLIFTNGKGSSKKASLASALGEYIERLSCNYFFADYYLGQEIITGDFVHYPNERWFKQEDLTLPKGLLSPELWSYYNCNNELSIDDLFDFNIGMDARGICALPFTLHNKNRENKEDKEIYFPVNILNNLYVSNGMSAGNSKAEARVQALCEIFERFVKNKIIAEGISLPQIPQNSIDRYPHIKQSIQKLIDFGYSLRICDASLGGVYPVISVTLINHKNASVFASFGSHPCFEIALERTITELLQGRTLTMMNDFFPPSFDVEQVASAHNLEEHFINSSGIISYDFFKAKADYNFVDWNNDSPNISHFEYLSQIIYDMNLDIYIANYEYFNLYACRIIIPKMSEIYPVDDLLWSNNNEGAYFRESILSLKTLSSDALQSVLEGLEDGGYDDRRSVMEFIGITPDEDTCYQTLQIGELKAMIYLALKEYTLANEWVSWCIHSSHLEEKQKMIYNALSALIEIKLDENKELNTYKEALILLYTEDIFHLAVDIIETKKTFYGLDNNDLSLNYFKKHQALLNEYQKLQKVKREKVKESF
jgi:ribosomal protein S12 methylthiotransferase accessory factor